MDQLNNKKKTYSPIISVSGGKLGYYFINLFILITVPYLITKFNLNPPLISILVALLIFVALPLNKIEYFFVEQKSFIVLYRRVIFLQFLNRKRIFEYDEINRITAILKHNEGTDITSFVINITSKFTALSLNILEFEMKNGKKRYVNTDVYKEQLLPILNYIQSKGINVEIIHSDNKVF